MKLEIAATYSSPQVLFDIETDTYLLKGRSLPEVGLAFYDPLVDWIEKHLTAHCKSGKCKGAEIEIMLDYCNTASFIGLMKLFKTCEAMNAENGCTISIKWYYEEIDEDWLEDGKSFEGIVKLPFVFQVIAE